MTKSGESHTTFLYTYRKTPTSGTREGTHYTIMKKLALLLMLAVCFTTAMFARTQEVVYLKNGSIIRGIIIEQVPNESLKIQTEDGSIFAYKMNEVSKITKEETSSFAKSSNSYGKSFSTNGQGPQIGYRGFIDLGYTVGTGSWGEGRIEFNTVHGYQFMPFLFAGIGAGAHYYFDSEVVAIPIFADIRADILNNSISPFIDMRIGYSPYDIQGFYLNPSIGCRFALSGIKAINTSIGYSMQKADSYDGDKVSVGGFNFRFGIEF